MPRFSIKWLLLAVAYVAITIAALLNANDHWRYGFHGASLLLVLTAILGTIFCLGRQRAFWAGWLVFGAAWFLLVFGDHEFLHAWKPRLTTGLTALHDRIFSPSIEIFAIEELDAAIDRSNSVEGNVRTLPDKRHQVTFVQPNRTDFMAVGDAVLCIPFALLGSVIATWFWRKRESERARLRG